MRIAVLGSGRGSNLKALAAHIASGHVDAHVGLVLTDRADAGILEVGRDVADATVSLPRLAGETRDAYDGRLAEVLAHEGPDLVVLAGFMRILGPRVLSVFSGRIVNIHPSILPACPGARGIRDTLGAGMRLAGCTTHIVDASLDGGPILLQAALAVRPGDDERSLASRVLRLEHLILPRTVQLFAQDRVRLEEGRARILPGPSWLDPGQGPEPVAGALYGDGY